MQLQPYLSGSILILLENKIQPSKSEDLIGFFKQFMNRAESIQQVERCSEGPPKGRVSKAGQGHHKWKRR